MTKKLTELADVIAWCQRNDIPADVVGRWVQHRGEWAHNCG